MGTGRTHDLRVYVCSRSAVHMIRNLLGFTVGGVVDVTNESTWGVEVEESTAHAVGASYNFASLFDNPDLDAAISALLGTRYVSQPSEQGYVIVTQGQWDEQAADDDLDFWQGAPVSFTRPGFAAPNADAITRPWSLSPDGRGEDLDSRWWLVTLHLQLTCWLPAMSVQETYEICWLDGHQHPWHHF